MRGVSAWFFGSAVVYGILGMLLGNVMGVTQDHSQLVTHAHMLLIGWVSFALFGFFYHLFPARAASVLARMHFGLAQLSYLVLILGLFLIFSGNTTPGEPIAGVSSMAYLLSMILFAIVALPVVRGGR
jgi:heme/copper-type cytochrome/quinol oxidase subunit 1